MFFLKCFPQTKLTNIRAQSAENLFMYFFFFKCTGWSALLFVCHFSLIWSEQTNVCIKFIRLVCVLPLQSSEWVSVKPTAATTTTTMNYTQNKNNNWNSKNNNYLRHATAVQILNTKKIYIYLIKKNTTWNLRLVALHENSSSCSGSREKERERARREQAKTK